MPNKTEESFNLTSTQYMRFFRLYRQERLLWDPQHESYSVRAHRRQAVDRIVRMVNVPGLQTKHIRLKIRSYRDMYTREIKKYGNKPKQTKPWWLNELDFLSQVKTGNKTPAESAPEESVAEESVPEISALAEPEECYSCDGTEGSYEMKVEQEQERELPLEFEFSDSVIAPQDQITLLQPMDSNEIYEPNTVINISENIPSTSGSIENLLSFIHKDQADVLCFLKQEKEEKLKEDHFDSFAKYVASLLRKLPKAKAYALQPKIIGMITSEHIKVLNKDE